MIERRNAWIYEALDLDTREILALENTANDFSHSVDPVRTYLRDLVVNGRKELPVCEKCDAEMDRETLCYCEACKDKHAEEACAEAKGDLVAEQVIELKGLEEQLADAKMALEVGADELLREDLANMRAELAQARARATALGAQLVAAQAEIEVLKAPKKRAPRTKKVSS
jgi:hypothetical protein